MRFAFFLLAILLIIYLVSKSWVFVPLLFIAFLCGFSPDLFYRSKTPKEDLVVDDKKKNSSRKKSLSKRTIEHKDEHTEKDNRAELEKMLSNNENKVDKIIRLSELKDQGMITEEEFVELKESLLSDTIEA